MNSNATEYELYTYNAQQAVDYTQMDKFVEELTVGGHRAK